MKIRLCIISLIAAADGLFAQISPQVVKVGLHGLKEAAPEFAVFGGDPVRLDVSVEAPLGSNVSLVYDLVQTAGGPGGLAAPLAASRSIGGPLDFDKITRRVTSVEVSLPEVSRRTKMYMRFHASGTAHSSVPIASLAVFEVYPKPGPGSLGRELAKAEDQSGLRLGIFGESAALRRFCKEQQIAFRDLGTELSGGLEKGVLSLGEITAAKLAERRLEEGGIFAVFFVSDSAGPPGIYRTITPNGCITKVTLPILENLAVNPQCQQIFIDTLQHTLHPVLSDTP